ncbi:Tetratricopeptide TPR_2 repeat protein (fragment) [Verrucomicrobia bacterium]
MYGFSGKGRTWLLALILLLVTLALYWPVRHYEFIEFDDPSYVFENQIVRQGLTGQGLAWSLVDAHEANWHPVTWISHMLDCQIFGLRAGAHHLVNVLFHGANAVLLFLVWQRMSGAFWRSATVACLFAWHPLRVESVAWISERKDVLSGFFFLGMLWAYVRYAQTKEGASPGQRGGAAPVQVSVFYWLAVVLFGLGLMSKAMLVTVPCLLLLLDYWPLDRFRVVQKRTVTVNPAECLGLPSAPTASAGDRLTLKLKASWPLLKEKLPFFVLSLASSSITFFSQRAAGAMIPLKSEGLLSRLGNAVNGYVVYLEKFFWPRGLAILYLRPPALSVGSIILAIVIVGGISAAALATRRRWPFFAVGWFWFAGMLLPVSGLVQTGLQSVADRYTYLPGIGLALILVWSANELAAAVRGPATRQTALAAGAVVVLCGCAAATRHQLAYWQDTRTVMERALQIDPDNYVAHNNLASYFKRIGNAEQARAHYERARELAPLWEHPPSATNASRANPSRPH